MLPKYNNDNKNNNDENNKDKTMRRKRFVSVREERSFPPKYGRMRSDCSSLLGQRFSTPFWKQDHTWPCRATGKNDTTWCEKIGAKTTIPEDDDASNKRHKITHPKAVETVIEEDKKFEPPTRLGTPLPHGHALRGQQRDYHSIPQHVGSVASEPSDLSSQPQSIFVPSPKPIYSNKMFGSASSFAGSSTNATTTTAPTMTTVTGPSKISTPAAPKISKPPAPAATNLTGSNSTLTSPASMSPKNLLTRWYAQSTRIQVAKKQFYTWNDRGMPHETMFTAVFVCPKTGEIFASGQYEGGGHFRPVYNERGSVTFWYKKKISAEHAAATRAYDCIMYREYFSRPADMPERLGANEPYLKTRAEAELHHGNPPPREIIIPPEHEIIVRAMVDAALETKS